MNVRDWFRDDSPQPEPEVRQTNITPPRVSPGPVRSSQRFVAAVHSNTVANWVTGTTPINQQLEGTLRTMRARARELAKDDPYVKRWLQLSRNNVIGSTGIRLRSQANMRNQQPDKTARKAIQKEWQRAQKKGVLDAKGQHTFRDLTGIILNSLLLDGEAIVHIVTGADRGKYGVQFRTVDPELLDVNHRKQSGRGYKVRMGVETDDEGKVVAYHLHSTDSTHEYAYKIGGRTYLRVPAAEIIHVYRTEFIDQLRGYPHAAAAMLRVRILNGYEEAELVGARGASAVMGFVVKGESGRGFTGEETIVRSDADDVDQEAIIDRTGETSKTIEAEPGTFHELEHGADVKMFDPNHPNSQYGAFIKGVLRGIASGLGVSYNTIANDLEGVNFSSIRAGVLEDREAWKELQQFIIDHAVEPMFAAWLRFALLTESIVRPNNQPLRTADLDRFLEATFIGRRWPWVDPQKDGNANNMAIDNRTRSTSSVIREMGDDPEDVYQEIADDQARMSELGILPTKTTPAPTNEVDADDIADAVDDDVDAEELAEAINQ